MSSASRCSHHDRQAKHETGTAANNRGHQRDTSPGGDEVRPTVRQPKRQHNHHRTENSARRSVQMPVTARSHTECSPHGARTTTATEKHHHRTENNTRHAATRTDSTQHGAETPNRHHTTTGHRRRTLNSTDDDIAAPNIGEDTTDRSALPAFARQAQTTRFAFYLPGLRYAVWEGTEPDFEKVVFTMYALCSVCGYPLVAARTLQYLLCMHYVARTL